MTLRLPSITRNQHLPLSESGNAGVEHWRWPVERFYWAVLDLPEAAVAGELPAAFRDELQDAVPVPVDDLHAVCAPIARDGSFTGLAVCAIPCEALAEVPPGARTLTPRDVPEFLRGRCSAAQLNLLVGRHEPKVLRRERRRLGMLVAASVAVAAALVCVGLIRRADAWEQATHDARAAYHQLLAGSSITIRDQSDPFALKREVERLRRATDASSLPTPAPDATLALSSLLRVWPSSIDVEPRSIGVRPDGITLTIDLKGEAKPFLDAFEAPPGWSLDEPRVSSVRGVTTINLQLRPVQAHKATGGGA